MVASSLSGDATASRMTYREFLPVLQKPYENA